MVTSVTGCKWLWSPFLRSQQKVIFYCLHLYKTASLSRYTCTVLVFRYKIVHSAWHLVVFTSSLLAQEEVHMKRHFEVDLCMHQGYK